MVHWDRKAFRKRLIMQIGILLALILIVALTYERKQGGIKGDARPLKLISQEIIPLKEISGMATFRENGVDEIVFVGDDKAKLFLKREDKEYSFRDLVLDRFSLCQTEDFEECARSIKKLTKNWEALAVDGAHRFFIMQEHSQSILVFDRQVTGIEHVIHFNFAQAFSDAIAKGSKKFRKNALAEGFILLKNGHILVAKEALPVALVEFGPEGDRARGLSPETALSEGEKFAFATESFQSRLVPLQTWMLAAHGKCDISDLALDQDKKLLALSEDCLTIQRYARLVPGEEPTVGDVFLVPSQIRSPEALIVIGDDWLVGSDVASKKQHNFYRLRP